MVAATTDLWVRRGTGWRILVQHESVRNAPDSVAAALVVGATNLGAQTPNFAGSWTLIVDPNAPRTGRGAPDALTIVQDSKTMTMDAHETTFVFNFDGTDSRKTITDPNGKQSDRAIRARWDGSTLRATMTSSSGTSFIVRTFAFSLDASGYLVVATSYTPPGGGDPVAMTSLYKKN